MKKHLLLFLLVSITHHAQSQTEVPKLLGACQETQLQEEPYAAWYVNGFSSYKPDNTILEQLKKKDLAKYSIKIFFGSWCRDSHVELPKMMKVLDQMSFAENKVELIAVDNDTKVYKQSPQREEKGHNIYRVPTFIIYKGKTEIGRIVESPAEAMEHDLLKIVSGKKYIPNYYSFPLINRWLNDGVLKNENVNARGLAFQLKSVVFNESELNACGYVLLAQARLQEAITVFRINANLYPQSANCFDSLGEAYAVAGLKDKAIQAYEIAVHLAPDDESIQGRLKQLKD